MTRGLVRFGLVAGLVVGGLLLVGTIGLLAGIVVTEVAGSAYTNAVVLALGAILVTGALRRFLPRRTRPLLPALVVQGTHAVWLFVGAIASGSRGGLVEVVCFAALLVTVGRFAGPRSVYALLAFQALQTVLHVVRWAEIGYASDAVPWLTSHVSLRVAGAALTWRAFRELAHRRERDATRATGPAGGAPTP